MATRVGINGFGRIGRNIFRAAKERGADLEFVAANDLGSVELMAHLLKYDSILGTFDADVEVVGDGIKVDGNTITILAERDPGGAPVGRARRRRRRGVHRPVHRAGQGGEASRRRARRSS